MIRWGSPVAATAGGQMFKQLPAFDKWRLPEVMPGYLRRARAMAAPGLATNSSTTWPGRVDGRLTRDKFPPQLNPKTWEGQDFDPGGRWKEPLAGNSMLRPDGGDTHALGLMHPRAIELTADRTIRTRFLKPPISTSKNR